MNTPKKKITFALIGCGNIAKKHVTCIKSLPEASLVGVFDVNAENLESFSSEHDI